MICIFFLSQSSPILELFPFDKITLKSYICTVVTVMAKQCWSQTVLESGSWGHSVLQTPALVCTILVLWRQFARNVKVSSLGKKRKIFQNVISEILPSMLSIKIPLFPNHFSVICTFLVLWRQFA